MGVPFLPWKLEFRQFRLLHIERVLHRTLLQRLGLSDALTTCCCPLGLSALG